MQFTTAELVQSLRNINIYASPDNTFNPDSQTILQILSDFGDLLCDNDLIQKNLLRLLPPDYSTEQFKFLKLLAQSNSIAFKLALDPFTIRDLLDPTDLKRFKQFFYLSAKYFMWRQSGKERGKVYIDRMLSIENSIEHIQQEIQMFQKQLEETKIQDKLIKQQFDLEVEKRELNQANFQKLKKDEERKRMNLQREIQQFEDQVAENAGLNSTLSMYSDKKFHFESQIIQDTQFIQQSCRETEQHLQQVDKELQYKLKELKLEEFKKEAFTRCLKKVKKNYLRINLLNEDRDLKTNLNQQIEGQQRKINELRLNIVKINGQIDDLKDQKNKKEQEQSKLKEGNDLLKMEQQTSLKQVIEGLEKKEDILRGLQIELSQTINEKNNLSSQILDMKKLRDSYFKQMEGLIASIKKQIVDYNKEVLGRINEMQQH